MAVYNGRAQTEQKGKPRMADKPCPKCQKPMTKHAATFALPKYKLPEATKATGDLVSVKSEPIPLAVYRCPVCHYLELYEL